MLQNIGRQQSFLFGYNLNCGFINELGYRRKVKRENKGEKEEEETESGIGAKVVQRQGGMVRVEDCIEWGTVIPLHLFLFVIHECLLIYY